MISTKTLADILTTLRFALAWMILWLGITDGERSLSTAVMVLVLAWTTDVLDGPLARHDPSGRHTWIGDRDLEVDISVGVGVLAYLALAGFVSPRLALGYGIGCAVLLQQTHSRHLAWAVQAPPYAGVIYFALQEAQTYGLIAVGYVILIVAATWPRFPQVVLPQFLAGVWHLGRASTEERDLSAEKPVVVENGNGNGHHWKWR